jgi:cytoskeletal protein RodZ
MSDEFFDYENQDPKNNLIAFLLIASCLFVVAVCAFLSWMFIVARDNEHNRKIDQATYTDLQNFRKAEDAKLTSYQYLDKDKGIVRIPVERAMQLMAEETKSTAPKPEVTPAAIPTGVKLEVKPAAALPVPPPPPPAKAAAAGQKK